jgi:recombination protein RecT
MTNQTQLKLYLRKPEIRENFTSLLGERGGDSYIASVLLAAASNDTLMECTPLSIYTAALRAAALHLSVDPAVGQAYLVPFKGKATLVVGYKGLHDLAVRTNRYRYINVGKIYEGEIIVENRISGLHHIEGGRTGDKVTGWLAAFEMLNGYGKTLYMTTEEIHAHAQRYSRGYDNPQGLWKKDPEVMERKTPLKLLLRRWGYLDPSDAATLEQTEAAENIIEGQTTDITETQPERPKSELELLSELGFDAITPAPAPTPATYKLRQERMFVQGGDTAEDKPEPPQPKQNGNSETKVKAASEPSHGVVTAFWKKAVELGIPRDEGLAHLKEYGNDFEAALKALL